MKKLGNPSLPSFLFYLNAPQIPATATMINITPKKYPYQSTISLKVIAPDAFKGLVPAMDMRIAHAPPIINKTAIISSTIIFQDIIRLKKKNLCFFINNHFDFIIQPFAQKKR